MVWIVLVAVLAVVAIVWVVAPLRKGARRDVAATSTPAEDAIARKHAALNALVDLEEELEIGKMSEEDFDALRAEYEQEALSALKELDALSTSDPLEDEIAEMRRKMTCPICGALRVPGETCSKCDAPA